MLTKWLLVAAAERLRLCVKSLLERSAWLDPVNILAGSMQYKIHIDKVYVDHAGAQTVAVTLQHSRSSIACYQRCACMLYAVVLMLVVCCRNACLLRIHRMPEESVVVLALPSHVIQFWLLNKQKQPDLSQA